jgi:PIN domain nuclease of toxin-antitoxin system
MIYLLDTHYLIWSVTDTKKIPNHVKEVIADYGNRILVSTVSVWEIALKYSLGKLQLTNLKPEQLPDECSQMSFEIIELTSKESSTYHQLKATYHKDPFDRMLIWQAIQNKYTLISADAHIKKYKSEGLKVIA